MTLVDAQNLALKLMAQHGLGVESGWSFDFHRKKRSLGTCNYTKKKIFLSTYFTLASTEEGVTQTLLHEIAHALCPKQGHNHVWLRKARELGYKGSRLCDLSAEQEKVSAKLAPFKAVCKNGHEAYRYRLPKKKASCALCSPRFNPEYILEYKRVA